MKSISSDVHKLASKLGLGTAQFGLPYGIKNNYKHMSENEAFLILKEAQSNSIDVLDTAYNYGTSEEVIGKFIKNHENRFKIISKLPKCKSNEVVKYFNQSRNRLGVDKIYAYVFHDFHNYENNLRIYDELCEIKSLGRINKIGFSLYSPQELDSIITDNIKFDILQIPFNIFDQRFSEYLPYLKNNDIEIHIRSIFMQGLLLMKIEELNSFFLPIKEKLILLNRFSINNGIPLSAICLGFALQNPYVDKIILGVDSLENIRDNINNLSYSSSIDIIYNDLKKLKIQEEKFLIPTNWKLN